MTLGMELCNRLQRRTGSLYVSARRSIGEAEWEQNNCVRSTLHRCLAVCGPLAGVKDQLYQ